MYRRLIEMCSCGHDRDEHAMIRPGEIPCVGMVPAIIVVRRLCNCQNFRFDPFTSLLLMAEAKEKEDEEIAQRKIRDNDPGTVWFHIPIADESDPERHNPL